MKVEEIYEYSPQEITQALAGGLALKQISKDIDHFIFVINSVDVKLARDGECNTRCVFAIENHIQSVDDEEANRLLQEAVKAVSTILMERMMLCEE